MLCKDCRTEMKKLPLDGVLVDRCPTCEGVWLDGGELEALAAGDRQDPAALGAKARAELGRERGQMSSGALCPRCGKSPLERHVSHGVALDRCRSCKGLWFDSGELERVRKAEGAAGLWGKLKRLIGA